MADFSIYTVGHGQLSWDELAGFVRNYPVEVIADVRSFPYVDYAPWFNRDQLEHLVRREGWEYTWYGGQLGALTADGKVDYIAREREPRYHAGIKELLTIAGERTTCLLGSQLNPLGSHRHQLIAQTLLKHNVEVVHILEGGECCAAQSDLFHSLL